MRPIRQGSSEARRGLERVGEGVRLRLIVDTARQLDLGRGVGEGRTGLESSEQSRLILYLGRDPGTPGADPVRALDRPGVHHGCTVPVRAVRPSGTQTHQGARQRVRDRAAERGK